jgi:holo-[acyl-carrier protein] synthase
MLIGTGIDIIRISRLRKTLDRFGDRFLERVFTPAERAYCARKRDAAPSLAARFAAKEAVFKAVGGTRRPAWRDIEVINEPTGKPGIRLGGRMAVHQDRIRAALALSHDGDFAVASVVVESAIPTSPPAGDSGGADS